MAKYLDDYNTGATVYFTFTTLTTAGVASALSGGSVAVYKDNGTTESTAGVTLTASFDSKTGLNLVAIDLSSDGTFYSAGHDFNVVLTAGTVNSVDVSNYTLATFSILNRSPLRPTTAGRTLDVDSSGRTLLQPSQTGVTFSTLTVSGATTLTGNVSLAAGLTVTQSSSNTAAVTFTGNGSGAGLALAGGSTGNGLKVTTTAGDGISVTPTGGSALVLTGQGASKYGAVLTGGTSGISDGLKCVAGSGGQGARLDSLGVVTSMVVGTTLTVSGAVTMANAGNNITGVTATVTGDVNLAATQTNAVNFGSGITANITGNLSGSVGSVSSVTNIVSGGAITTSGGKAAATMGSTDYSGNTVQTGDSFARIGATGSGLTSLAPSATALSTATWTNTLATNLATTNTSVAGIVAGSTVVSANVLAIQSQQAVASGTVTFPAGTLSTLTQSQVTGGAYSVQDASCVLGDARIANLASGGAGLTAVGIADGNITDAKFTLPTLGANQLASGFVGMGMQTWRRFEYRTHRDIPGGTIAQYAADGTTLLLTQNVTVTATSEDVGKAH